MDEMIKSVDETGGEILAVGYVRCATDDAEAQASAAAQKARIQALAAERGIRMVDWHVDMGFSGNNLERAGLQAVLAAAQSPDRGFDAVVVDALDRLSKRLSDLHAIEAILSESGIRVISVTQPDWGPAMKKLVRKIYGAMSELQSDAQSQDTRRGLRVAAEQGYWVFAQVPYGYRKVEVSGDGRRRSKLGVDPETAEVVRAMYDHALGGSLPPAIAAGLNERGVPSPSGGAWTGPQVRRILRNPANAGVVVLGRKTDEPVEVREAHTPIVSWEVFGRVNHLLERGASGLEAALR